MGCPLEVSEPMRIYRLNCVYMLVCVYIIQLPNLIFFRRGFIRFSKWSLTPNYVKYTSPPLAPDCKLRDVRSKSI